MNANERLDPEAICSLPTDARSDRLTWIRDEIVPHVIETRRSDDGLVLELAAAPGVAEKIDHLIELERGCCSEIGFARLDAGAPDRLRLEIRGVDPDAAMFRGLGLSHANPPAGAARLARAAGAGVLASFLVCCVLPIGAMALLGAAAAPLAKLDGPVPLAAGALIGGSGAWWWLGRERRRRPQAPAD